MLRVKHARGSGDTIDTPGLRALVASADVLVSEVMNKAAIDETECAFMPG